jgi:LPXTG-site transpeptidase (sortase) family protein
MTVKWVRFVLLVSILISSLVYSPVTDVYALSFPAQINKSFTPISIVAGDTSILSVTIYNPNSFDLTSAHYRDFFPAGIILANPVGLTNSCGGTVTDNANDPLPGNPLAPGGTVFRLDGGDVPPQVGATPGQCTITVNVTSTTPGNLINTIPSNELTSDGNDGGTTVHITNTDPASATLQVGAVLAPSLNKNFNPNTIFVGSSSILTINIINNDPTTTLTETGLTDNLPLNVTLANPVNPTTSVDCGTGSVSGNPGDTSVTLSNAQIGPNKTCSITVNVTSLVQGPYINTIPAGPGGLGSIHTRQGVTNTSPASANLNVQAFTMTKGFGPASIPAGNTSTLTITIRNRATFTYTGVGLFDDLYPYSGNRLEFIPGTATFNACGAMSDSVTNTGLPSTVNNRDTFSGGTIAAGATCTITVSVRAFQNTPVGSYPNTIAAGQITTTQGATNDQPVTANLGVTGLIVSKVFGVGTVPLGGTTTLTITITNPSNLPYTNANLLDDLNAPSNSFMSIAAVPNASTTCAGGTVTTGARTVQLTGGTIPANSFCTITVTVVGTTVGNGRTNTIPVGRLTTAEGGTNAVQATANINITNVVPTIGKAFAGASGANNIQAGGTSTLTITITNPDGAVALTGMNLVDNLATTGTGLLFTSLTSNSCGGVVTGAGTQVITLTGGALTGGSPAHSCTIVVLVTMPLNTNGGTVTNTIPVANFTNDQGLGIAGNVNRNLVVRAVDVAGKTFTPSTFQSGGTSSLVITLQNFTGSPLTIATFNDNLAAPTNSNLSIAAYPPATAPSTTCAGGVITATAGTQLITLTGGTIPAGTFAAAGTCTITIPVTGSVVGGPFTNTIPVGALTTTQGPSSRTARTATVMIYPVGAGVSLTKTFGTNPINAGSNSLMTLTINAPADTNLTNFKITDPFPANLVVGNPPAATVVSGCGALAFAPAPVAGATSITASGGTITTGTPCIIRVNVTSAIGGVVYANVIHPADITDNETRSIPSNVTTNLTVNTVSTLVVTKNFQPTTVNTNGLSTLTIYLENSNLSALINAVLTDNLPGTAADGVVVAPIPNASTTCGAGVITANPGASTISMANGTIPARVGAVNGLCSITVDVQGKHTVAALPFTYTNNIPILNVTGTNQTTGETMHSTAPASADLIVAPLSIDVVKGFNPLIVTGGASSTLSVQISNPNNSPLTGIKFEDDMPAGMIIATPANLNPNTACFGAGAAITVLSPNSYKFSGGSLPAAGTCTLTLSATMTVNGNLTNTIPAGAVTTFNGASSPQDAAATLTNLPGASISKDFAPNPIYVNGVSSLTITIQNTGNIALSGMGLVDDLSTAGTLPNGVTVAGPPAPAPVNNCGGTLTTPTSQTIQLVGGSLAGSASCTLVISVTGAVAGSYTNTIPASTLTSNEGATNKQPASDTLVILPLASIGDFVWNDLNANGIQDAGEPGIPGVTVNLLDSGGATIGTTTTNASGLYSFTNLMPGTYSVQFVKPGGYTFSPVDQGANDAVDSDANTTTGVTTSTYTLASGDNNTTVDAGMYQLASLGDFVWNDTNNNGIQDAGEAGIPGVTVHLLDSTGTTTLATTTTDANGLYHFTNLTPGSYRVGFVLPLGYSFSAATQGGDITVDSNADTTTGITTTSFTLASGDNNTTIDAGMHQPAALGDFVWNDLNANGIQDAGEAGIPNVTVNLLDSGGATIDTTTTDANGLYHFTNLPPGTYSVQFVNPGGYTFSPANQGANDALDSDANTATGVTTSTYTLAAGDNNITVDAGLYQPASLGDFVWDDLNNNGIQDAGEPGIQNVSVNLLDSTGTTTLATTTTDVNGLYHFPNLTPGTYRVEFVKPVGYTFSSANQGADDTVDSDANTSTGITTASYTLASGDNNTTVDAGLHQSAALGDFVWDDLNANGIQDAGEAGVQGVTVNLLGPSGNAVLATTTTDVNGNYSFTGLTPGTYRVEFVPPAGDTFSPADQGADDAVDSDANTTTGITTASYTLASGDNNTTVDAGLITPAALGDFVWNDLNNNGIQDAGEAGIPGVTVHLLDSTGTTTLATTTTDASGLYHFTNLAPGTYRVSFVPPSGYAFSPADQGANDAVDSDADTSTGITTASYTLASGDNNLTVDAGLHQLAALGDFVWNDSNANGIQDAGEAGIPNVTVNLLNSGGAVIATTTTDANGLYHFTNLAPGTYSVQFVNPGGYTFSPANQGANDAVDSDADTTTGVTGTYTLAAGENNTTVDAGLHTPAALGDFVWNDANANGIQDAGETGIPNVTVNLLDSGGAIIATTTTDASGLYHFTNLTPGTYRVEFVPPAGYTVSPPDQGANDAVDSDANTTTGITTTSYTLASGDNNTTVDAGMFQPKPGLFDPPSGRKVLSATNLPELEWRMVWINNTNAAAINSQITDPIPAGTTYVLNSLTCVANNASVTLLCQFDPVKNQVFWQGSIGPDLGVTDPANAVNSVVITFRVTVDNNVNLVNNQGSSLTDTNGNNSFADETTVASVAVSNVASWSRGGGVSPFSSLPKKLVLPSTGFAPGVKTELPPQPSYDAYNALGDLWLEIPRLGVKISIVGIPLGADGNWDLTWLSDQAGYLNGTAYPTHAGNSVLTGHVYLADGSPGPFVNLSSLHYGDQIIVHLGGQRYIYQVREDKIVTPDDSSVFQHEEYPWLTLVTCKDYNAITNTYAHRVAIGAVLINIANDTPPGSGGNRQ